MTFGVSHETLDWLLAGDVSIRYRVRSELLHHSGPEVRELRRRIATEGWGRALLDRQRPDGDWGRAYYQPKWTCTHYTLLELAHLRIPQDTPGPVKAVHKAVDDHLKSDGAFRFAGGGTVSDDCVSCMFLMAASYFNAPGEELKRMVDHLLTRRMNDGAWNCEANREATCHSSVHTTISCLEGFLAFSRYWPSYRSEDIRDAMRGGEEFLLRHHLCWSDHSGEVMNRRMTMLSWPTRWYFDVLRGMEYFADAGRPYDQRMDRALDVLRTKRRKDGRWPVQNRHPGATHFEMERPGTPSRWNTFRALKVLAALDADATGAPTKNQG